MSGKRVLVYGLTNAKAGTEAVICNFVRAIGDRIDFDFLSFEEITNHPEAVAYRNRVVRVPNKRTHMLAYTKALGDHFRLHANEYEAVWANLNILNNIDALRLGAKFGIERRILHAHNSFNDGKLHQKILCAMHRPTIGRYVTDRWACSAAAGEYFFGSDEYVFVPNAINAQAHAFATDARRDVREELGIAADALVVGCVGRLVGQKNYRFLIDLWPQVLDSRPDAQLLVAGDGELRGELQDAIDGMGVGNSVRLLGARDDVTALLSAFDVFAMPSLFEGLPLSLVEAQFNGLPCVVSDTITTEAQISTGVSYVPLFDTGKWVERLCEAHRGEVAFTDNAQMFDLAAQSDRLVALFEGE